MILLKCLIIMESQIVGKINRFGIASEYKFSTEVIYNRFLHAQE
jgi:hypothetical protein